MFVVLQAAVRDPDPVCILENELLYGQSFPIDKKVLDHDFTLPIGKAKIQLEGKDVTLVAFSKMVGYCLEAAEKLKKDGISAEVINLRTIKPLDRNTLLDSIAKTHRCALGHIVVSDLCNNGVPNVSTSFAARALPTEACIAQTEHGVSGTACV